MYRLIYKFGEIVVKIRKAYTLGKMNVSTFDFIRESLSKNPGNLKRGGV